MLFTMLEILMNLVEKLLIIWKIIRIQIAVACSMSNQLFNMSTRSGITDIIVVHIERPINNLQFVIQLMQPNFYRAK